MLNSNQILVTDLMNNGFANINYQHRNDLCTEYLLLQETNTF